MADEEGYCNECGFRREKPREHTEIVIDVAFAAVTDQGKRHAHNEDNMAIAADGSGKKILIVCDGVSSSQDAAAASKAAATAALASLQGSVEEPADFRLRAAVRAAWHGVADLAYTMSEGDPPSTTFVAALVDGNVATVAWAGDSRAYWLAGEHSKQLTVDDSWLNDTVAEGKLSYEEALHSDKAHAITKWLGADAGEPEPSVVTIDLAQPGVLLLCTDGLWNYAEAAEKIEELAGAGEAIEMARRLVDFANGEGGRDNITAAVYVHTPVVEEPKVVEVPEPVETVTIEERIEVKRVSFARFWFLPSFQRGT
jgi:serine/threonine protein phosphatase PrpC